MSCKKPGQDEAGAKVVSRTKGSLFANILIGGGVGALIDHNNGAAYDYPAFFWLVMGALGVTIDSNSPQSKPYGAPAEPKAAAAPPPTPAKDAAVAAPVAAHSR